MAHTPIKKSATRCFIIRIYRAMVKSPDRMLGQVEEVGREGVKVFNNIEELWEILKSRGGKKTRGSTKRGVENDPNIKP